MKTKLIQTPRLSALLLGAALALAPLAAFGQEMSRLERQIRHELVMLPFYSLFDNFEFRFDGNTVTLMGQVTRPTLKNQAERVVSRLEEVQSVDNQIEVLPVSPNDDRIRRDVYRAIYHHQAFNRYSIQAVPPIHIIVNNGNVTLIGAVANKMEKDIANVQANGVAGVFSVTNKLRVDGE